MALFTPPTRDGDELTHEDLFELMDGPDPAMDGWPAEKVFDGSQGSFAYDDLIFMPGHVFEAGEADTSSQLTKKIRLKMPVLGSPVDTVTEAEMAISLALAGGMGIIHANQTIENQVEMIKRVKRHVSGFILEPLVLGEKHTLADWDRLRRRTGVSSAPITDTGKLGGRLLGWVGARETEAASGKGSGKAKDRTTPLTRIMVKDVARGQEPITLQEATEMMQKAKVGKMPIVDEKGNLVSLVTRSHLKITKKCMNMSKNLDGQLMVGASVHADAQKDWERAKALAVAGADLIFIDASGSFSDRHLELIQQLKAEFPETDVISGPVGSCREAKRIVEAGVDAVVVGGTEPAGGHGLGFSGLAAIGQPEATAIYEIARYVRRNYNCPTIAGSGVHNTSQLLKSLCLGATAVILSDALAGTDEAPGSLVYHEGSWMKLHHSNDPVQAPREAELKHALPTTAAHSVSSAIFCQGPVESLTNYMCHGLKRGLQDLGFQSLVEAQEAVVKGELRMEARSHFAAHVRQAALPLLREAKHPEVMPLFVTLAAA